MTKPLSHERLTWLVERNKVLENVRRKAQLAVHQTARDGGAPGAVRTLTSNTLIAVDAEIFQNQLEIEVLNEFGVAP